MPGLTGGRWRSSSHGEPERRARRETGGTEPDHLPLADPPAAYLTGGLVRHPGYLLGPAKTPRPLGSLSPPLGAPEMPVVSLVTTTLPSNAA